MIKWGIFLGIISLLLFSGCSAENPNPDNSASGANSTGSSSMPSPNPLTASLVSAELMVSAPMSKAELTIQKTGTDKLLLTYDAKSSKSGVKKESESFEITQQQFNDLSKLFEDNEFTSFQETYEDSKLLEGTTYSIRAKFELLNDAGQVESSNVHLVTCYGKCPSEIIEIREKIAEIFGKEIMDIRE